MTVLAVVIGLLGFVALMVFSTRFRIFGYWIIGLALVSAFVVWRVQEQNAERARLARTEALNLISKNELSFTDLHFRGSGDSWTLDGVVTNRSSHAVRSIKLRINIFDCPQGDDASPDCLTVGEYVHQTFTEIPAGQTRRLTVFATFDAMPPPQGERTWSYEVEEIEAVHDPTAV